MDDEANTKLEFLLDILNKCFNQLYVDTHGDKSEEIIKLKRQIPRRASGIIYVRTFYEGFEGTDEEFKKIILSSAYFYGSKKLAQETLSDFFENEVKVND